MSPQFTCSTVSLCTSAPVTNPPVTPKALSAGQKRTHPSHIPSHFPDFPDPHTYIKTPVSQRSQLSLFFFIDLETRLERTCCCFHPADVQRACVRLPGSARESSNAAERCGASAHTLHGEDRRNTEPLQRRRHCFSM